MSVADRPQTTNPFRYGDLALDDAFTDRVRELQELKADMRNGQNVVVFAPRRYGKSSLIWRASHELIAARQVLIAIAPLVGTARIVSATSKITRALGLALAITDDGPSE